jgi:hypothetical protein
VNNGAIFELDRHGLVVQLHQKPVYFKNQICTHKNKKKKKKPPIKFERERERERDLTSFIVGKEEEGWG